MAIDIIEHAGWTDLFAVIRGAESDGTHHLKNDVIKWTMGQMTSGTTAVAMAVDRAAGTAGCRPRSDRHRGGPGAMGVHLS